jgi:hypothetical protein
MAGLFAMLGVLLIGGGCSAGTSAELTDTTTMADTSSTAVPPTTRPASPTTEVVVEEKAAESTTTASAPVLDPEAVAFAEGLIADLNVDDIDAVAAPFPDGVDLWSVTSTMGFPSRWAAYGVAMESTWELGGCKSLVGGMSRCVWFRASEHEPYYPEPKSVVIQFRLESGVAAYAEFTLPNDPSVAPETDFTDWMLEIHPSQAHELHIDISVGYFDQWMVHPLDEAEIKKEYVPLWRGTLGEWTLTHSEASLRQEGFWGGSSRAIR